VPAQTTNDALRRNIVVIDDKNATSTFSRHERPAVTREAIRR
jgi:hypothetical protein